MFWGKITACPQETGSEPAQGLHSLSSLTAEPLPAGSTVVCALYTTRFAVTFDFLSITT